MMTRARSSFGVVLLLTLALACSAGEESKAPDANPCSVGSTFLCANGGCIPRSQKCDGRSQCSDGSDEQSCSGGSGSPDAYVPTTTPDARVTPPSDGGGGGGCGSVTEEGECTTGRTGVRWCEGGTLKTITCGSGDACAYDDTHNMYDCMAQSTCGSVSFAGGCDDRQSSTPDNSGGSWLYWCEGEGSSAHVEWVNCYPDLCTQIDGVYDCLPYEDSCDSAFDSVCDEPSWCDYGTDQSDCYYYGNNCSWAYDGECDEPYLCWYGTDNYDCIYGY